MRRARWPAAARCPEGYHTKRQYGTTWPKSQQDCGLAVRVIFRQGKESPLFRGAGKYEKEGAPEHSGFFDEENSAARSGRAHCQAEAACLACRSRWQAALDQQEIGPEGRMNFRL